MTVIVVGSINADEAVRVTRLPGPGETVHARSSEVALGGKGANQAVAAARAGAAVIMVGAVGADATALIAALDAEGVATEHVARLADVTTGRAIVLVDDRAENSIVVVLGANYSIPQHVVDTASAHLGTGDVLILQNEIPPGTSRAAAELARAAGATVIWNAAPAPTSTDELIADVDLIVVNEHELAAITALLGLGSVTSMTIEARVTMVAEYLGADLVCTLGAAGAAFQVDGQTGSASTRRTTPVDTTAAGDTVVGYLAATVGQPFPERLRIALSAGTLTVTHPGAAGSIPTLREVHSTLVADSTERTRA